MCSDGSFVSSKITLIGIDILYPIAILIDIFIQELEDIGISAKIRFFTYLLIKNKEIYFANNGDLKGPYLSYTGVPQSSILSLILFNIYVRESLLKEVGISQYADDILIFARESVVNKTVNILNAALNKIDNFLLNIFIKYITILYSQNFQK